MRYVLYGHEVYLGAAGLTAGAMYTKYAHVTLGNHLATVLEATQEGIHHVSPSTLTSVIQLEFIFRTLF